MRNKTILFIGFLLSLVVPFSYAWSTPPGVIYYENLTFDNKQSYSLAANTPIPFTINSVLLNAYVANNLVNVEIFNGFNNQVINSWVQNGTSNSVVKNSNSLIWVQFPVPIPATTNSVNTISIGFQSLTSNVLNGKTTGIAPQLWCSAGGTICPQVSYGQYDNGNYVFGSAGTNTFYINFTGKTLPSWLNKYSNTVTSGIYTVNNGLVLTYITGVYRGAWITSPLRTVNSLTSALMTGLPTTSGGGTGYNWFIGEVNSLTTNGIVGNIAGTSCPNIQLSTFSGITIGRDGAALDWCSMLNGVAAAPSSATSAITATSIMSSNLSSTGLKGMHNYTSVITNTLNFATGYSTLAVGDSGTSTNNLMTAIYWLTTLAPPSGVYPIVTNTVVLTPPVATPSIFTCNVPTQSSAIAINTVYQNNPITYNVLILYATTNSDVTAYESPYNSNNVWIWDSKALTTSENVSSSLYVPVGWFFEITGTAYYNSEECVVPLQPIIP